MSHTHSHPHMHRKAVVNRLAKIEGHVRAIKLMAMEDRDCSDLLIQIAAARKALDNAAKVLLFDHLESCVIHASEHGDQEEILDDLKQALDSFIR